MFVRFFRRLITLLVSMFSSSVFLFSKRSSSFSIPSGPAVQLGLELTNRACFGAGCYWGTEKFFKRDFGAKVFPGAGKVLGGKVGFMGPPTAKQSPTYEEVCRGDTQQVEVYDLEFEGDEKTYEALVRHFFMFHDPTTFQRQGFDMGSQYASTIFVYDEKQREIATRVRAELQALLDARKIVGYAESDVVTEIREATTFFPAEESHQEYLDKNPGGYCNHRYRFTFWPEL